MINRLKKTTGLRYLFRSVLLGTLLTPHHSLSSNVWEQYKSIRNGDIVSNSNVRNDDVEQFQLTKQTATENKVVDRKKIESLYNPDSAPAIDCPEKPDWIRSSGTLWWFKCTLDIDSNPAYTPYGIDYPFAYMAPSDLMSENTLPVRMMVYLHPFDNGRGSYVNNVSSFHFKVDRVELHNVEQNYSGNTGGYWVYSGNTVGKPGNYNGRQIAASIDYLLKKYGERIDLDKGIHMKGKSLGGAGVMHQAMILPNYQSRIAIVESVIGKMMIPKNHHKETHRSWGDKLYDTVDIRLQWPKVKHIHFYWRGGSNDTLGVFDSEFIEICEQRKLSCALTWLRSGHGVNERGYNLPSTLWTDKNQDATLDKILPVITNNSSNYHGKVRGYHNRGLTWHHNDIVDSQSKVIIPLKYEAMKNIGEGVPDQPDEVTFSLTPRRISKMSLREGDKINWVFGGQSGSVVVNSEAEFTIDGLMLTSDTGYENLILTHD